MATDFDRDDRLHGLLRDTLRSEPASGPCIDAAMLAAWAEDALTPEETAATDAHLATCARCRELVATVSTMAATEGAPAAAVVPFTPRPNGRWKVIVGAMGAVAASVLIWVAVRDGSPSPDSTAAVNRAQQSQAGEMGGNVASPANVPAQPAQPAQSANALQPRADVASEAELRLGQQRQRAADAPRPEAKLARENTARAAEPSPASAKPSPAPAPAPVEPLARAAAPPPPAATMPPPPSPPATPPPAATAGAARSSTVAVLPQSSRNFDITGIKQADPMRSGETFFGTGIIAEFVVGADLQVAEGQVGAVADQSRAGGAGRGGGGAGAAVPQRTTGGFFSKVPGRWRLRGAPPSPSPPMTAVERSNDGGATWQSVRIDAKTPELAGGSAPTNTVCWLVGQAGTVLLSTDGTTFRHVTKPADADLVSVRATDARRATVRTADGRTFTTTDGGVTWTPRSQDLSHEDMKDM